MTVRYKRNRSPACYYDMDTNHPEKPEPVEHPRGPHGNHAVFHHGFCRRRRCGGRY